jgi:hypothetical protein
MHFGGWSDYGAHVRRITRLADSIRLPKRRRGPTTATGPCRVGAVLVRGRGLRRRRPRSPLPSLLAGLVYLLLGVAATLAVMRLLP